jgi:hypothetical protein
VLALAVASVAPASLALGVNEALPPGSEPDRMDGVAPTGGAPAGSPMFVVGDITLGEPEPGAISVVAAGRLSDSGHLPIVIRNGRDGIVYDVRVVLTGLDAGGTEVGVAEYFIPTGGLAPGDWAFSSNAQAVPGLGQAQRVNLEFSGSSEPGDFVWLDVLAAELRDGAIVGTISNTSSVRLGDFNPVNVACFQGNAVTAYELTMAETLGGFGPGESAPFATEQPIDPATCPAYAVYAIGLVGA